MQLPIFQVDAFTDQLFGGNPAAVVPLEKWLPDEHLQKIAAENNLAETAYFIPQNEEYHLRWFTPAIEVDLCGHATVATAHVLFEHLGHPGDEIIFHSPRSGRLGVKKAGGWYILDFPTDKLERVVAPAQLAEGLGAHPLDLYRGREDYLAVFDNKESVGQLSPDFRTLKLLGGRGVICTAPGTDVDFVSRCFFPAAGIDEDPVTGSAHTTLTPYWAKRLGKNELTARQISKRGGYLRCKLKGDRTEISGKAVTYLEGKIWV